MNNEKHESVFHCVFYIIIEISANDQMLKKCSRCGLYLRAVVSQLLKEGWLRGFWSSVCPGEARARIGNWSGRDPPAVISSFLSRPPKPALQPPRRSSVFRLLLPFLPLYSLPFLVVTAARPSPAPHQRYFLLSVALPLQLLLPVWNVGRTLCVPPAARSWEYLRSLQSAYYEGESCILSWALGVLG